MTIKSLKIFVSILPYPTGHDLGEYESFYKKETNTFGNGVYRGIALEERVGGVGGMVFK